MTYHVKIDEYACPKCSQVYVPFKKDMECPKCGFVDPHTEKYHYFIAEVLKSMSINKNERGRFRPDAWYTGSTSDAVLSTCFRFFDYLEQQKPKDPIAFLNDYTARIEVDDEYDRKFIHEVLLEVYKGNKATKKSWSIRQTSFGRFVRHFLRWLSQFW